MTQPPASCEANSFSKQSRPCLSKATKGSSKTQTFLFLTDYIFYELN